MKDRVGIWLVREQSEGIGRFLETRLRGTLYRPWESQTPQREQFRTVFPQHQRWVLIMATGIAMRFMDGSMPDKHSGPAVVVLDEACRFAIPLLGAHEAGGNELAYRVANAVDATPVVTTATEVLKPLVVGIGCRLGVTADQIGSAVTHALGTRRLADVREVAPIRLKAEEPGLLRFCAQSGIPLRVISTERVAARAWVTQASEWVRKITGTDGVCEPCALIACTRGKLVVPKTALDGVAVAVVEDRCQFEP